MTATHSSNASSNASDSLPQLPPKIVLVEEPLRTKATAAQSFRQFMKKQISWMHGAYVFDWIVVLVLLGVAELVFGFTRLVKPFGRAAPFAGDLSLQQPFLPDIIPVWLLLVLSFAIPAAVVAVAQILRGPSLHDVHHALLAFVTSFAMNELLVNVFKNIAGMYRPHYLTLCNPPAGLPSGTRVTENMCRTKDVKDLFDAHLSFPSGHAAAIFCSMVFLTLYMVGKFRLFARRRQPAPAHGPLGFARLAAHFAVEAKSAWKLLLCVAPLVLAFFVAVSRTMDYHHHFADIVAGAFVGTACATVGYHFYYHSLANDNCDAPRAQYGRLPRPTVMFSKATRRQGRNKGGKSAGTDTPSEPGSVRNSASGLVPSSVDSPAADYYREDNNLVGDNKV